MSYATLARPLWRLCRCSLIWRLHLLSLPRSCNTTIKISLTKVKGSCGLPDYLIVEWTKLWLSYGDVVCCRLKIHPWKYADYYYDCLTLHDFMRIVHLLVHASSVVRVVVLHVSQRLYVFFHAHWVFQIFYLCVDSMFVLDFKRHPHRSPAVR
jgi:hypothetical protein